MTMTTTRVALAQINPTVGDFDLNKSLILNSLTLAQRAGCDIVVFPELAVCGYPPEDLLLRKSFLEKCRDTTVEIATKVKDMVALVGTPWQYNWGNHRRAFNHNGNELFNSAVIMANGKIQDIYFKTELPNYGVFDEKRYFSRLDTPECLLFVLNGLRFGVTICEDIWIYPSPVQTLAGMNNVDITLNLSASPFFAGKLEESRYSALHNYCSHTGSSLVYCNLVGGQDSLVFDGTSVVMDSTGEVHHMAERFEEDLLIADLDSTTFARKYKQDLGYVYRDYYQTTATLDRTFAYEFGPNPMTNRPPARKENTAIFEGWLHNNHIEEIYLALVLGLQDYVIKNGFEKVVIGNSGGIDSALVTALAVEALGNENVIGITMPSRITSDNTQDDAIILMENFGIQQDVIRIESLATSYSDVIAFSRTWSSAVQENPVVWENIQARIRGNILMALSNQFGWLVLSTGNKSETAVGYCTLYGDMAGGFSPIKDVRKLQVYALVDYVNTLRRRKGLAGIPESIIERPPSAELSADQVDTDALGPYEYLDEIVRRYVEQDQSRVEVIDHFKSLMFPKIEDPVDYAKKMMRMIDRNEYKRRQGCPGIKITPKAFGKDRRMPITNGYS
jgi:NAD+ synthase (glutamine-hydrolysing)